MNQAELKSRAQRLCARLNQMGFTKDGKPMVVDQAYELVAAEEGFRNQHALRAKLEKDSFVGASLCIPRELTPEFAEAIMLQKPGTLTDTDYAFADDAWGHVVVAAEKHTQTLTNLALTPEAPEQCDGSDFVMSPTARSVWLSLGEVSVHVCRGSEAGQATPDAGVRVFIYPAADEEVVLAEVAVTPEELTSSVALDWDADKESRTSSRDPVSFEDRHYFVRDQDHITHHACQHCGTVATDDTIAELRKQPCSGTHLQADPLKGNPKLEVLEALGYDIDGDGDQPGMWIWTAPTDGCEQSYASAKEALDAAWVDAVGQTMGILNLSSEDWDALSFAQQKELITETLSGD